MPAGQHDSAKYTAEDPEYLKGEITGQDVVAVADFPYVAGNCSELQFVDYSGEQAAR